MNNHLNDLDIQRTKLGQKYKSELFFGHADYRRFLQEKQNIKIDSVNVVHDRDVADSVIIMLTYEELK